MNTTKKIFRILLLLKTGYLDKINLKINSFQKDLNFQNTAKIYEETILKLYSEQVCHTIEVAFQPAITCSELTLETLEQGVKYVQSQQ